MVLMLHVLEVLVHMFVLLFPVMTVFSELMAFLLKVVALASKVKNLGLVFIIIV